MYVPLTMFYFFFSELPPWPTNNETSDQLEYVATVIGCSSYTSVTKVFKHVTKLVEVFAYTGYQMTTHRMVTQDTR